MIAEDQSPENRRLIRISKIKAHMDVIVTPSNMMYVCKNAGMDIPKGRSFGEFDEWLLRYLHSLDDQKLIDIMLNLGLTIVSSSDDWQGIFIIHSGGDSIYAEALTRSLNCIGVTDSRIYCSSVDETGTGIGNSFFDVIKKCLRNASLVICLLSENSIKSPYCLQEMGGAMIMDTSMIPVLLNDFPPERMPGFIDNTRYLGISIKDSDSAALFLEDVKKKMNIECSSMDMDKGIMSLSPFFRGHNMSEKVDAVSETIKQSKIKGAFEIATIVSNALIADATEYIQSGNHGDLKLNVQKWGAQIIRSRPSQVTLRNTVNNLLYSIERIDDDNDAKVLEVLRINTKLFLDTVNSAQEKISLLGANIIQDGDTILTNSYSSMVKAIIKVARELMDKDIRVIVTETRPKYQGIRMARELIEMGVDTTVIVDSAVRHIIRNVDLIILGADTVSSDGSVITKIGSSQMALVANEARVPLYVAAPTFKFSEDTLSGVMVSIEEGKPSDIYENTELQQLIGNDKLTIRNPTFDATPPEYIRGIITELYVMSPFSVGEYLARKSGVIHRLIPSML